MRCTVVIPQSLAVSALLSFALAFASPCRGSALFQVNFSGGSGSPLTVTLPQALTATVTNDTANPTATFVIVGTGDVFGNGGVNASGGLSYTRNGAGPLSITDVLTFKLGAATSNDMSLYSGFDGINYNINDVLLLSSGSVTTHSPVASAPPASGLYTGFIMDRDGVQLGDLSPVPEPASFGLLALAGTMLLCRRRRSGQALRGVKMAGGAPEHYFQPVRNVVSCFVAGTVIV
jgi:hypothetical protein